MFNNVVYVARIKLTNKKVYTNSGKTWEEVRDWVSSKLATIDSTRVVEIETRKRDENGLPLETNIKFFYEWRY